MNYTDALAYLDDHASYDTTGRVESPTIERISRLMDVSGEPHRAYPVIHITGTNGKGSTTQMITRLLMAQGLTVGTYTSPHLERLNERISRNAEPIGDEEFAEQIASLAEIEIVAGVRPTYFELVTAAAFRWFADVAVDVAVVEVGMLGTWMRPTWSTPRSRWSPTSAWTTTSTPARPPPTSPARRAAS
ncbi:MAG: hypothetical protein R2713_02545 [Ilumatobacteraceae bacterium]